MNEKIIHRFESKVLKIEELTPTVKNIYFSIPEEFYFENGQYVSIAFMMNQQRLNRSYTIASDNSKKKHIELCIKKIENGPGSTYLHNLKIGDKMKMIGPIGKFTLEGKKEGDIVLISTGTGVAPFRAMIPELLRKHKNKIFLFSGYRYENEILYKNEFLELAQRNLNFFNYYIISRPSMSFTGETGRVQKLIVKYISSDFQGKFLLCGLSEMIDDVKAFLISKGFPEEKIYYERYD